MSKRVGIYGGAFDPITLGHIHVIKSVLEAKIVDEIWVIPTYIHFHGKQMVRYADRLEMCNHAIYDAGLSTSEVTVKQIELAIAELEPEYDGSTTSLLKYLRMHQCNDYYIIIGQDNADSMHTWKNGSTLIHDEKFIVIPRSRQLPVNRDAGWYEYPPNVFMKDIILLDVSSTMVREACKRFPYCELDRNKVATLISENVCNYIVYNRLYKGSE